MGLSQPSVVQNSFIDALKFKHPISRWVLTFVELHCAKSAFKFLIPQGHRIFEGLHVII